MVAKKKNSSVNKEIAESNEILQEQLQEAQSEIVRLSDEVADKNEQMLRALAELENFRKRSAREREEQNRYGCAALAREILPIADNLSRALLQIPQSSQESDDSNANKDGEPTQADSKNPMSNFVTGVQMTEKMLYDALNQQNIVRYTSYGEIFDAHWHEVMAQIADTGRPAGEIVQVFQYGYRLHDRVLQPARVGVADGKDYIAEGPQELKETE